MWSASIHVAGEHSPNGWKARLRPWIPLLEHERPDDAPSAVFQTLRNVEVDH